MLSRDKKFSKSTSRYVLDYVLKDFCMFVKVTKASNKTRKGRPKTKSKASNLG